jgi:gliding motility-associated-like protein
MKKAAFIFSLISLLVSLKTKAQSNTQSIDLTTQAVIVPNTITPNNDGKNDSLVIEGLDNFPDHELTIFSRWGETVFKTKTYANNWKGKSSNNKQLPDGTYLYVLSLDAEKTKKLKGHILIVRE